MPYALSLLLDDEAAVAIRRQWDRLAADGLSQSMPDLGYPPHVTLVVCERLDGRAAPVLDGMIRQQPAFDFSLTLTETFGPDSGVIYAALAPCETLRALHAQVAGVVSDTCRPHYQPGHWTPHCTLATGLSAAQLDQARRMFEQHWVSLAGRFVAAELVAIAPITPVKRWPLHPR